MARSVGQRVQVAVQRLVSVNNHAHKGDCGLKEEAREISRGAVKNALCALLTDTARKEASQSDSMDPLKYLGAETQVGDWVLLAHASSFGGQDRYYIITSDPRMPSHRMAGLMGALQLAATENHCLRCAVGSKKHSHP